jgi:hypothetical protein
MARKTAQSRELIVLHCFAAGDFLQIQLADGSTGGGFNAWKQRVNRRCPHARRDFPGAAALLFH